MKNNLIILIGVKGRKIADACFLFAKNHDVALYCDNRLYTKDFQKLASLSRWVDGKAYVLPLEEKYINIDRIPQELRSELDTIREVTWLGPNKDSLKFVEDKSGLQHLSEVDDSLPIIKHINIKDIRSDEHYVVKPIKGSGSRGVYKIRGDELLTKDLEYSNYVIQPYIDSSYQPFGFSGFALDGEIRFYYFHRRVLTKKGFGGSSLIAEIISQPLFLDDLKKIVWKSSLSGFFMIEYILDKNQNPKVIEINPRLWGSFRLGCDEVFGDHALKIEDLVDGCKISNPSKNRVYFSIVGFSRIISFINIYFEFLLSERKIILSPHLIYLYRMLFRI